MRCPPSIRSALALCLAAILASPLHAAPGDLDPTFAGFGTNGIASTGPFLPAMAVQSDGKIVLAGPSGLSMLVKRYLPDGSIDASFGVNGSALFTHPSFPAVPTSVAIQSDGKIIVAGWFDAEPANYMVARLTAAGNLDPGFGSGGWVSTNLGGDSDLAEAVVIQPDGRIIAGGTSFVGGNWDFSAARYLTNGSLDPSFGGDGIVTFGLGGDDKCRDIALEPNGRLVMAGEYYNDDGISIATEFGVARLDPDGTHDTTFNLDGELHVEVEDSEVARAVALEPDGRIVIVGNADTAPPSAYANDEGRILVLNPLGFPDDDFAGNGKLAYGQNSCDDVIVQPDGRFVILGFHESPDGDWKVALNRFYPSGTLDAAFDGGEFFLDLGTATDRGRRLALLPDGRIIANCQVAGGGRLVQLWPNATLDAGGRQAAAFDDLTFPPGSDERAHAMAIQSDGKIVVVGEVDLATGSETDFALARFQPDGQLDTSFGMDGRVALSFQNFDVAKAVALQSDGKIVVAGSTGTGSSANFMVARFLANGSLDTGFGFGGFNVIDFAGGADHAEAVAIAPDGKIVLAGTVFNGARNVFGIARFNANGTPDNSFDLDAKQLVEFQAGLPHAATAVVVLSDKKIVVGGSVNSNFALLRLNENGSLDGTFGLSGLRQTDMGGADALHALAVAPNGFLYAAGTRIVGLDADFAVAQYKANGSLASCPPFPCSVWSDGMAFVDWSLVDAAYAVDVRIDGKVVVAGESNNGFAWAQFTASSPTNPIHGFLDFVEASETARAVRFVGTNQVVLAGIQTWQGDDNFALARFETTPGPAVGVANDALPSLDVLEALRPNPSTGFVRIGFTLARTASVRLLVHDVSGRVVRVVDEGSLDPGRHQATWDGHGDDGSPMKAGMYFVAIEVEGRQLGARRLTLLH